MSGNRYDDLARSWLRAALTDLSVAELVLHSGYHASACFHAQQSAEKALKAYLLSRQRELLKTHLLPRLLRECESIDAAFGALSEACTVLTAYYVDTRYPDAPSLLEEYDSSVAHQALDLARHVVHHVQDRLTAPRRGQSGGGP